MIKLILKLLIDRIRFRYAIHILSKGERWSFDYLLYLLKKLASVHNQSVSLTIELYDKEGHITQKVILDRDSPHREVDLKEQEHKMEHSTLTALSDELYAKYQKAMLDVS